MRLIVATAVVLLAGCPWMASLAAPIDKVSPVIELKADPFPLEDVRLLDGPFRNAMLRDKAYLLSLDADRLLHNFRVTAGLPSSAEPLGGWEGTNCEVRGHCVGHYLSACSLMYASTGDTALKQRTDYLVAELAKCQEAMPGRGFNKGFLSAYPESFFDRVDRAQNVWAPYYTLHKIMAGLLDTYKCCDNPQALEVITRMADWLKFRVGRLSAEQMQRALWVEHGGMNEVLANLYAVTGNPDHLKLAQAFNHQAVFAPLAAGEDKLNGLHANTQIPKITGAARQYELTGDRRMHDIAEFFWQRVALNRSYVIGGDSDGEHFFPTNDFAKHLSPETAETCNTYNMLKLTRHLFEWEPSARLMDFYERGLYNQILASQDPDSGMMTYFVPLQAGRFKTYSTPLDSFWCCVGTGMENHAKYGDTIYFHGTNALYVNLFIPSELRWAEKGVTVRQETKFPEADTTTLTLGCASPATFALRIRHPAWAGKVTVRVNGRKQKVTDGPGSYLTIERAWRNQDKVEVLLPMRLHLETLPGDAGHIAFLYGPVTLAGRLGVEGLPPNGQLAPNQLDFAKTPLPEVPTLPCKPARALARAKAVKGEPLTFQLKITEDAEIPLVPFYELHHERYAVYWKTDLN
ncbi:MAG: beta-L-arabinofuranosidase domain-containing protein [Verrucomicrobiota bacterium]